LSITAQLELGVRFLDFRVCEVEGGTLHFAHRFPTALTLEAGLAEVREFLARNPTEFVLVYLRVDWDNRHSTDFGRATEIAQEVLGEGNLFVEDDMTRFPVNTPVADLQGKVILFHDEPRQVRVGDELLSFEWKLSTEIVDMWRGNVDQGLEAFRRYFGNAVVDKEKLPGIICDVTGIPRPLRGVARIFNREIQNMKNPKNKHPGLVVVDHLDVETAHAIFRTFLPQVAVAGSFF
jgi:hypothetical protein